jgi:hypothetical protein
MEIQCHSQMAIEKTPLDFQNFLYQLLDKMKKENKVLKINIENNNSILQAIRRDCKELLNLKIITDSLKKGVFIIKIYDTGEKYPNEGLNIEISQTKIKITQKKINV